MVLIDLPLAEKLTSEAKESSPAPLRNQPRMLIQFLDISKASVPKLMREIKPHSSPKGLIKVTHLVLSQLERKAMLWKD